MTELGELAEASAECSCIEKFDEQLAPHNTRLARSILFDRQKPALRAVVTIQVEKIEPRGKKTTGALPTFCPFCGVRYRPETPSATPQE